MKTGNFNINNLIQGFILSCQAEAKSPKTIEWYSSFLNRFSQFLNRSDMPDDATLIDKHHIRAFIRYLQTEAKTPRANKPLSPTTVSGYVRTLKAFFSWLEREDYVANNPMHNIPVPKSPAKIIETFNTEQITKLIEICRRSDGHSCRDLTIILVIDRKSVV
jgi:site-specific recombinase XerD